MAASQDMVLKLWADEAFKDFTFLVKGVKIKAHMNILASQSPVFERMFTIDMREKDVKQAIIDDADPKVFRIFIQLFYGYGLFGSKENVRTGIDCYTLCDKYQVDHLKSVCLEHIQNKATIQYAEELLEFDSVFELPIIRSIIKNNLTQADLTTQNLVHFLKLAAKIEDEDRIKKRVFEFICEKKIQVSKIPKWRLVSRYVGDELQEFMLDRMYQERREVNRLKQNVEELKEKYKVAKERIEQMNRDRHRR